VGFLSRNTDDALIWRGPMKMSLINQFVKQVEWGNLDYLVVDCPPGTGDEPLSVVQLLGRVDGAVIVTTPQKVAAADVRKSVDFCMKLGVPIIGVVENMSGFACPKCGEVTQVFRGNGGEDTARAYSVPFLGRIPIDPAIVESGDEGRPFVYHYGKSATVKAMEAVAKPVLALSD
jgi:Mrp family chromosome partitioning ATPase